jgi:hypothetical protein
VDDPIEKREFKRYTIDPVDIEVSGVGVDGKVFSERPLIHNISGDGVSFSSQHPEKFSVGQSLDIVIHMPGTDTVKADMKAYGKVIRMQPFVLPDGSHSAELTSVSVQLAIPFGFERIDDDVL